MKNFNETWLTEHPVLALVVGPLLGLVYVMFLPFIGFAVLFYHLGGWVMRQVQNAACSFVDVVTLGLVPGRAYLAKKRAHMKEKKAAPPKPLFAEVEREIERKKTEDK